jgi:hypothetical protein
VAPSMMPEARSTESSPLVLASSHNSSLASADHSEAAALTVPFSIGKMCFFAQNNYKVGTVWFQENVFYLLFPTWINLVFMKGPAIRIPFLCRFL